MAARNKKTIDPARFEGNGISYRAKLIGIEDVSEARGDKMCQDTIQQLKTIIKMSGQHKQRIFVNVTLDGLRIYDAVSMKLLHTHPVHQISFISRDVTDSRAFGYIFGAGDGKHKFFGIKTASAAENLVLALRDLFQTVYEMKKKEVEEAKAKVAAEESGEAKQGEGENIDTTYQVPPNGAPLEGQDSIYQVPKNNAPVKEQEEVVANLLDLEDQAEHILKGIEQIKNLEFDDLPSEEAPKPAASPAATSPAAAPASEVSDPWGLSAMSVSSPTSTVPSSSLTDLQGLQQAPPATSNPFGGMQAFPGTPAPAVGITGPGGPFAVSQPGGMPFMGAGQQAQPGGLPVTKDPFGDDPFGGSFSAAQPRPPAPQAGMPFGQQPGLGNPFPASSAGPFPVSAAGPFPGQPFPGQPFPGAVPPRGLPVSPGYGLPGPGFAPFGLASPPVMGMQMAGPQQQQQQQDPNLLQPLKPGGQQQQEESDRSKSPKPALFSDLVDIKKSADTAKSPKELFKDIQAPPKKSLNEIKSEGKKPPAAGEGEKASDDLDLAFTVDPFGSLDTVLDTTSAQADPFNSTHVSPPSSSPPPLPPPSLLPPPPAPPDPSTHPTRKKSESERETVKNKRDSDQGSQKESSPEAHFDMPDIPPPPLPAQFSMAAPAPPPRPRPRDRVEPPVPQRPRPKPRRSVSSSSASSVTSPVSASLNTEHVQSVPTLSQEQSSEQTALGSGSAQVGSQMGRPGPMSTQEILTSPAPPSSLPPSVLPPSQPPPLPSSQHPSLQTLTPQFAADDVPASSATLSTESYASSQLTLAEPHNVSTGSSPCVFNSPPSPCHSIDSSLSHASSQKSLNERTLNLAEEEDPFGVPLRSKRSSDGAKKSNRSSSSASRGSIKSDTKVSAVNSDSDSKTKQAVNTGLDSKPAFTDPFGAADPFRASADPFKGTDPSNADPFKGTDPHNVDPFKGTDPFAGVDPFGSVDQFAPLSSKKSAAASPDVDSTVSVHTDPFGVPVSNHVNSSEETQSKWNNNHSPVSADAFGDAVLTTGAKDKWEAFGDNETNGVKFMHQEGKKSVTLSGTEKAGGSPFGDSFVPPTSAPAPVNGKPQEGQSLI